MECSKCGKEKDVSCFASRGDGKLHKQCKECKREAINNYYVNNREKMIARSVESNKKIRKEMMRILVSCKKKPCVDCGKLYPHYCMDFDHLPGSNKIDNVSCMVKRC